MTCEWHDFPWAFALHALSSANFSLLCLWGNAHAKSQCSSGLHNVAYCTAVWLQLLFVSFEASALPSRYPPNPLLIEPAKWACEILSRTPLCVVAFERSWRGWRKQTRWSLLSNVLRLVKSVLYGGDSKSRSDQRISAEIWISLRIHLIMKGRVMVLLQRCLTFTSLYAVKEAIRGALRAPFSRVLNRVSSF